MIVGMFADSGQIAPLKYRHISAAAGAFGELFFAFIVIFGGGIAIQNVGWPAWLWQILSCAFAVPLIYFYCPEVSFAVRGRLLY